MALRAYISWMKCRYDSLGVLKACDGSSFGTTIISPGKPVLRTERQMAAKTTNPFTFLQQVRSETAKVTWPTRRETVISSLMVFVFAFIAAIFFFASDQLLAFVVELVLGIGR